MQKLHLTAYAALFFCLPSPAALAAGAYVVDDADIVEPGKFQNEDWYSHGTHGENLGVADLAYQALPHTEFTLLNAYDVARDGRSDAVEAQAKYQWRDADESELASSVVFGAGWSALDRRFSTVYAYVPSSLAVTDFLDLNADFGWEYESEFARHYATWGVSAELKGDEHWSVVGEIFGRNGDLPGAQIGPRWTVSENLVLDLIYGRNIDYTPGNWITAGLTVQFE